MAERELDFFLQLGARIHEGVNESYQYNKSNLVWVGLIASVGFPLYYVVWQYWFPQPYESLLLRIAGSLMFIPFVVAQFMPRSFDGFLPWYWLFAVFYAMPFFFVYMWLMNGGSSVWGMSTVCAIFLLEMLVYDWLLVSMMGISGFALAWWLYGLNTGVWTFPPGSEAQLPIFAFAYVAGTVFSYKKEVVAQTKLDGMYMVTSNIANELKAPFSKIGLYIKKLNECFPKFLEVYENSRKTGACVEQIPEEDVNSLSASMRLLAAEVEYSRVVIEMMSTSASQQPLEYDVLGKVSVKLCIEDAIERFPYSSEMQRRLVHFQHQSDYTIRGSERLIVHVFFQLIKNALQAIERADKGTVLVWCEEAEYNTRVFVRDTGSGMSKETLMRAFDRFFSTLPKGEGAGVGLYFCRKVMESLGGRIEIDSEPGQYTEVILAFPKLQTALDTEVISLNAG